MEGARAPVETTPPTTGTTAMKTQPKMLSTKTSDLLVGGLSVGAIVDSEFASAWEPTAWKQWLARDAKIQAKIAKSENYTMQHLADALEQAIPKRIPSATLTSTRAKARTIQMSR